MAEALADAPRGCRRTRPRPTCTSRARPRAAATAGRWCARAPGVTFKLPRFEGPLDLLLHLIKRDEIDIYDIPIAHITQQYLQYIELMRMLDLDVAGDFLVMAATLMRIKAKMLLPLPRVRRRGGRGRPARGTGPAPDRVPPLQGGVRDAQGARGRAPLAATSAAWCRPRTTRARCRWRPRRCSTCSMRSTACMARQPERAVYDGADRGLRHRGQDVADRAHRGRGRPAAVLRRCMRGARARMEIVVSFMALLELIKLGTGRRHPGRQLRRHPHPAASCRKETTTHASDRTCDRRLKRCCSPRTSR